MEEAISLEGRPARIGRASDLDGLLTRWRDQLKAWEIPAEIGSRPEAQRRLGRRLPAVDGPPNVPTGSRSFAREWEVLEEPGSVLDVGAGTGDASLVLRGRATRITAVDTSAEQLKVLEKRGIELGAPVRTVQGSWPAVAGRAGRADLVVCHYVLYEISDLGQFIAALTAAADRRVVATVPAHHPQAALNPLWDHFHGLRRPEGPTAYDALAILEAMDLAPASEVWIDVDGFGGYADFDEMVDRTRQRLCLSPDRHDEVAEQLVALGVDPLDPKSVGTVGRKVMTMWWSDAHR